MEEILLPVNNLSSIVFQSLLNNPQEFIAYLDSQQANHNEDLFAWEYIVKTYITSSYKKENCKKIVYDFWSKFVVELKKLSELKYEIIEAARLGYDQWLRYRLTQIPRTEQKSFVDVRAANTLTALHYAVKNAHLSCVDILLEHHANPNIPDYSGETAVHYAARNLPECMSLLLAANPDFELTNNHGLNALFIAALNDANEVAELIIQRDSNTLKYTTGDSEDIFFYSAKSGSVDVLKILLKHGFNVDQCNWMGKTAMQQAATNLNIGSAKSLIHLGADVNKGVPSPLYLAMTGNRYVGNRRVFVELLLENDAMVTDAEMDEIQDIYTAKTNVLTGPQVNLLYLLKEASVKQRSIVGCVFRR